MSRPDDTVQLPSTALKSIAMTTAVVEQMVSHLQTLNSNLERLLLDTDHVARTASAMQAHADDVSSSATTSQQEQQQHQQQSDH